MRLEAILLNGERFVKKYKCVELWDNPFITGNFWYDSSEFSAPIRVFDAPDIPTMTLPGVMLLTNYRIIFYHFDSASIVFAVPYCSVWKLNSGPPKLDRSPSHEVPGKARRRKGAEKPQIDPVLTHSMIGSTRLKVPPLQLQLELFTSCDLALSVIGLRADEKAALLAELELRVNSHLPYGDSFLLEHGVRTNFVKHGAVLGTRVSAVPHAPTLDYSEESIPPYLREQQPPSPEQLPVEPRDEDASWLTVRNVCSHLSALPHAVTPGWAHFDPIREFVRMGISFEAPAGPSILPINTDRSHRLKKRSVVSFGIPADTPLVVSPFYFEAYPHMRKYFLEGATPDLGADLPPPSPLRASGGPGYAISFLNTNYRLSDSYPAVLAFPAHVSDDDIAGSAAFRSSGRLPALSWHCPTTQVSLSRCAQPCPGFRGNRNLGDENLIRGIRTVGPASPKIFIFDARPRMAAFMNQVMGKGVENIDAYDGAYLLHLNIENIHAVRDSFRSMRTAFSFKPQTLFYQPAVPDQGLTQMLTASSKKVAAYNAALLAVEEKAAAETKASGEAQPPLPPEQPPVVPPQAPFSAAPAPEPYPVVRTIAAPQQDLSTSPYGADAYSVPPSDSAPYSRASSASSSQHTPSAGNAPPFAQYISEGMTASGATFQPHNANAASGAPRKRVRRRIKDRVNRTRLSASNTISRATSSLGSQQVKNKLPFDTVDTLIQRRFDTYSISAISADSGMFAAIDQSQWLHHVRVILAGALLTCEALVNMRCHVVVHCSDGWDRTSQLSSLPMLLMDPYYRTLDGFAVLIEKEWCAFGHMFATRTRHFGVSKMKGSEDDERRSGDKTEATSTFKESQVSPVFVQFLDCVHQVLAQFPDRFEFNEDFLLFILYHAYAGRCGTFMFDNEQDRVLHLVPRLTVSVWDLALYDARNRERFTNRSYDRAQAGLDKMSLGTAFLPVSLSQFAMVPWFRLWRQHFRL
eukprot:gnl/Chilomastix_cuspidata/901.p1 GENE.gnl/Chilomastix_cuspidata/901~~gnl/Chilomastix_cuspidata/901.p1  ORF type:complete len:997 (+),score=220.65 gnl/Chilomastix_cuspidata/901:70-2991(+)